MSDGGQEAQRGFTCPKCGCHDHLQAERRYMVFKGYRRIRYCRHCDHRVVTFEKIVGDADYQRQEEP